MGSGTRMAESIILDLRSSKMNVCRSRRCVTTEIVPDTDWWRWRESNLYIKKFKDSLPWSEALKRGKVE